MSTNTEMRYAILNREGGCGGVYYYIKGWRCGYWLHASGNHLPTPDDDDTVTLLAVPAWNQFTEQLESVRLELITNDRRRELFAHNKFEFVMLWDINTTFDGLEEHDRVALEKNMMVDIVAEDLATAHFLMELGKSRLEGESD